ncbi:hypothetical protein D770_14510 [Flammeovirgaceae bacterium 311]|nr:hypothetical protein D770_14510 [Flammeovirgaceae bacterium 311]
MLQLKNVIACIFLITVSFCQLNAQHKIEQWDYFEISLKGTKSGNPFTDVKLSAEIRHADKTVTVHGFYDGEGVYKIRFMPDRKGRWSYVTSSNRKELNGKKGKFEAVAATEGNNGPVVVKNQYHFSYSNNKPYLPLGTTCYAWLHQDEKLQEQTLQTLKESPFNKLRMTVFPKYFDYNRAEPQLYPYVKKADGSWDFTRFNPAFFRNIEKRVKDLQALNIEADIILFHPYDKGHWGFDQMPREASLHYLNYVVARLSAFRNVWWSMANEFDLMKHKSLEDWESYFALIQEKDPYKHLASIHNGDINVLYDHSKPYITHVSVQSPNLKEAISWRKFGKPVINDECEYEGNLPMPWGNISGEELVHRAWQGYGYGIYVGHSESFEDNVIWWSHGGELKGESAARFAFLKQVMQETSPEGLDVFEPDNWLWLRFAAAKGDSAFVYYFGEHQPARWHFIHGKKTAEYSVDVIDTWNMTINKVEGKFKNGDSIPLPGKPNIALRLMEIKDRAGAQ